MNINITCPDPISIQISLNQSTLIYMVMHVGVPFDRQLERRARLHDALGDPLRLAIVDELAVSDRSPGELGQRFGVPGNLLAHHLSILEDVGLVCRFVSAGDRRRRYVRLLADDLALLSPVGATSTRLSPRRVTFVCSQNSARSQLAAALWTSRTGGSATSAGTVPAERVHPGAVAAARRAGLDLGDARPRRLTDEERTGGDLVITVCDRAHEELPPDPTWLHWSVPDPVGGPDSAFDDAIDELDRRIGVVAPSPRRRSARPARPPDDRPTGDTT